MEIDPSKIKNGLNIIVIACSPNAKKSLPNFSFLEYEMKNS